MGEKNGRSATLRFSNAERSTFASHMYRWAMSDISILTSTSGWDRFTFLSLASRPPTSAASLPRSRSGCCPWNLLARTAMEPEGRSIAFAKAFTSSTGQDPRCLPSRCVKASRVAMPTSLSPSIPKMPYPGPNAVAVKPSHSAVQLLKASAKGRVGCSPESSKK